MENGRQQTYSHTDRADQIAGVHLAAPEQGASPRLLVNQDRAAVEIDTSIYTIDAILRATYKFTDRCYILLQRLDVRPNCCVAHLTRKGPSTELLSLVGEFENELLDQQLRLTLETQFGPLRTLIVAQAFAEGNLLDQQREEGDYIKDPRGISGPPR